MYVFCLRIVPHIVMRLGQEWEDQSQREAMKAELLVDMGWKNRELKLCTVWTIGGIEPDSSKDKRMCETGSASNSCNKSHVCTVSLLSKMRNVPKQISSPLWTGTLYQSHPMRAKLAATSEKQSLNVFEEYCWKRLCRGIKCVSRLWIYKKDDSNLSKVKIINI